MCLGEWTSFVFHFHCIILVRIGKWPAYQLPEELSRGGELSSCITNLCGPVAQCGESRNLRGLQIWCLFGQVIQGVARLGEAVLQHGGQR